LRSDLVGKVWDVVFVGHGEVPPNRSAT
jgi:hypothetical protein